VTRTDYDSRDSDLNTYEREFAECGEFANRMAS
jgi:hypothetical protein